MNEESQVRGCYNITFIYTNQETVYLQGHWGKEDAAVMMKCCLMSSDVI